MVSLKKLKAGGLRGENSVQHAGRLLPPRGLRAGGEEFKDDAYYLKSARLEAARLVQKCGLTTASRVLDVGCGAGRLAVGILAELGGVASYTGIDVIRTTVDWCQRELQPTHSGLRFLHVDVQNERYNPAGDAIETETRLPLEDASADVINLYSVFSHMTYGDVVRYLHELRRVIAPSGKLFLTAFIETDVPNYSINPPGYREQWTGALHCVRFERGFFEDMLGEARLKLVELVHGRETNGQSALYIAPA
jgi:SAM-dependent methyltransferase